MESSHSMAFFSMRKACGAAVDHSTAHSVTYCLKRQSKLKASTLSSTALTSLLVVDVVVGVEMAGAKDRLIDGTKDGKNLLR